MDKNIKVHIKDRVAVAEGDPVIICGNSDYTITFSFDEEWGGTPIKTARFNFCTAEGPAHFDQPFEGDTVEVPILSDIREVEVGVFVGDLNTTTGAYIRCRPCIRCGSGAPKDPTPDVYDIIMKLLSQGGSLEGPAVCAVKTLPEEPEEGEVVLLTSTAVIPWDQVKLWTRDEVGVEASDFSNLLATAPSVGDFKLGDLTQTIDLGAPDDAHPCISGVFIVGPEDAVAFLVSNAFQGDIGPMELQAVVYGDDGLPVYGVLYNQEHGWYSPQEGGEVAKISPEDLKIPAIVKDARVMDYMCTLSDLLIDSYEEDGFILSPDRAFEVAKALGAFHGGTPTGLYIAEASGDSVQWQPLLLTGGGIAGDETLDEITQLVSEEVDKVDKKVSELSSKVDTVAISASQAKNAAEAAREAAHEASGKASSNMTELITEYFNPLQEEVWGIDKKVENLSDDVLHLNNTMDYFGEFLDMINGEGV